ncbi:MAG TPA: PEP-CTERM sorting domain-containing protein, partial [Bryobacteraceae bacterium]
KYSYGAQGINYYGGFAANGPNGSVAPGTFAFVGFRFNAADGVHFGWVRLAVNAGLIDFDSAAYETTPNTAILAGAVPEPGTMALLALGAAGILGTVIKRRRA